MEEENVLKCCALFARKPLDVDPLLFVKNADFSRPEVFEFAKIWKCDFYDIFIIRIERY